MKFSFDLKNIRGTFCNQPDRRIKRSFTYLYILTLSVFGPLQLLALNCEFTKSRGSYEHLMGITLSGDSKKMFIHYYCTQRQKWMKWLNHLDYRLDFAAAIMEHQLYILGGRTFGDDILKTVICLNMKTMTVTQVKSMIENRANCGAAVLNGFLYVVGGWNGARDLSSVERWDPKVNIWNKIASVSIARSYFGLAGLNDKLYAIGGFESAKSAEFYDPNQNVCTTIATMGHVHWPVKAVAANGVLYAVDGDCNKTVERYDNAKDQWSTICDIHEALLTPYSCTTFQDKVAICYYDRVDVYNDTTDEWKADTSLKGLANIYYVFSYSDQLLTTEFAEN